MLSLLLSSGNECLLIPPSWSSKSTSPPYLFLCFISPTWPPPLSKLVSLIGEDKSSISSNFFSAIAQILSFHPSFFPTCESPSSPCPYIYLLLPAIFHFTLFSSIFYTFPISFSLLCVYMCGIVSVCLCVCMCVCMSQCTEVVARARLLAEDLAAPVAAHLPVAPPIPVPISAVRARYQPRQEALGPAGQALPAARPGVTVHPAGAHAVAPRGPNCGLQQLVGTVVQGG